MTNQNEYLEPGYPRPTEEPDMAQASQGFVTFPFKQKDLPPIFSQIVAVAPLCRKTISFITAAAPLGALCPRIRLSYPFDSPERPSGTLLQVIIEGEQSSGKSFADDIQRLIIEPTLGLRDRQFRRIASEYRENSRRRKGTERLDKEPVLPITVLPATVSKAAITKHAEAHERIFGEPLYFWQFSEELSQAVDSNRQAFSNMRTISRIAYDLGATYGQDYVSENSYSGIFDINMCMLYCCTPAALDAYMDRAAVEGGNVTRIIRCPMPDNLGSTAVRSKALSPEQKDTMNRYLAMLMDDTYGENETLKPQIHLNMSWMDRSVKQWCDARGEEALKSGSIALDVFRKRASVSAYRVAAICYHLYHKEQRTEDFARRMTKKIYEFMANFILQMNMERWGGYYEKLHRERLKNNLLDQHPTKSMLYDDIDNVFTRNQLEALVAHHQLLTRPRQFIYLWKKSKLIVELEDGRYAKTDYYYQTLDAPETPPEATEAEELEPELEPELEAELAAEETVEEAVELAVEEAPQVTPEDDGRFLPFLAHDDEFSTTP